jgi:murein DD-endopeptidase MepM/ murein hydrolase activator NlpD
MDTAGRASAGGELARARVVDFPLRGEWRAVQTPASRVPSHGTDMLGQRYAYDFVRFDPVKGERSYPGSGARALLLGVRTRDCYGWGEPIHAPLAGVVVAAHDGEPERATVHPVRELFLALRNGLTFRPTPEALARVMGNHVILRCADVFAAFAHLVPGSVAVCVGSEVQQGEVIGRVGHTGNSTAPHLHFQLMDGPDPLQARGIPCAFASYEVESGGRWRVVTNGIPKATDRMRSLDNAAGG